MRGMEDRSFTISITSSTVIKTIAILVVAWLIFIVRDIVLDVLTAVVIASAVEPGVAQLRRRRIPRTIAVIIIYLVIIVVFFGLFYFFFPFVLEDFASFVAGLPTYLDAFTRTGAFDTYAAMIGVPAHSLLPVDNIMASIRSALDIGSIFSNAFGAASAIFGGFFSLVLILVFSFYFAVIETGVDDFLRVVTPHEQQPYVLGLWRRSQHKIGLWMQGQLLLALIMGVLVYLGLTIFGIPHALILAVIASCFEIIPVFGPILAAVPAVMFGFVDGGVSLGLVTIAIYVIAQQFESQLIYPLVVSRVVGVPPLLVILALIIGGSLAGFLGIILSVPAAATIQELVKDLESGRLRRYEEKKVKT
jgi:predicted PurR-regulated permease PerM